MCNADAIRSKTYDDRLLGARSSLDCRRELDTIVKNRRLHRSVIRRISIRHSLRRDPDAMTSTRLPGRLTAAAELVLELLEQVLAADKATPDHARANIGGRD
jgi:hypothetical protein